MTVILGSRRRFWIFWALAFDSMATHPSKNPYHMATAWIEPSWLSVHMVSGRRSWRNASTSAGVILICPRWFTPCPMGSGPVMDSPPVELPSRPLRRAAARAGA